MKHFLNNNPNQVINGAQELNPAQKGFWMKYKRVAWKVILFISIFLLINVIKIGRLEADSSIPVQNNAPLTATIEVIYTGSWDSAAQAAFDYAVDIWANSIYSSEQIDIEAYWWTGSGDIVEGFGQYVRGSGVPFPDAYYPISLRNAIRGSDHNVDPDFRIRFNDTYNWYFGTDGQTPPNQYDFVTAALKAIGQKLGLESRTHICYVDLGCFGSSGEYYVYEVFVVNGQGQQLISFPHASPELKTQLTSNNLYFSGPAAVAVHGGTQPKLYAPAIWQVVNVEHLLLDEAIYPPEGYNALMTAILQPGEAHHDPGPLARAMLYDLGWPRPAQAPVLNPLPNQFLLVNTSRDHAIDLWDYANDPDTAVWNLVFSLVNSPAPQAGISFESGHYINIHPDMDWTGSTQVTIEVEDPTNLTDSRSFDVFVVEQIYQTFLPAISGP